MSLRLSYTFLAPFYDLIAGPAFRGARRDSLAALPSESRGTVLLNGVGSGLDFQFLPRVPGLRVLSDEPAVSGGWFRRVRLERT
jgi:hypothetical protein